MQRQLGVRLVLVQGVCEVDDLPTDVTDHFDGSWKWAQPLTTLEGCTQSSVWTAKDLMNISVDRAVRSCYHFRNFCNLEGTSRRQNLLARNKQVLRDSSEFCLDDSILYDLSTKLQYRTGIINRYL